MNTNYLADHPEYLPTIARWVYDEWEQFRPDASLAHTSESFQPRLQRDAIPLTLVGLRDGALVGTASIFTDDMDSHPELGPWLAAVYVDQAQRGQGIGSALVEAILQEARRLAIPRLYLWTPDQEHFYARLGWQALEHTFYDNHDVVLMTIEL